MQFNENYQPRKNKDKEIDIKKEKKKKNFKHLLTMINEDRIIVEMEIEFFLGRRREQQRRIKESRDNRAVLIRK